MSHRTLVRLEEAGRALEAPRVLAGLIADALLEACPRALAFACTMRGRPARLDVIEARREGAPTCLDGWRSVYGRAQVCYDRSLVEPSQRDRWIEPVGRLMTKAQWRENPIQKVAARHEVWALGRMLVTIHARPVAGLGVLLPRGDAGFSARDRQQLHRVASMAASSLRICARLSEEAVAVLSQPCPHLTPRQHAITSRMAQGMSNAEIAAELGLRPSTIKTVLERLYRRHGVRTRTALARALF